MRAVKFVTLLAVLLAGCGGNDEKAKPAPAEGTDRAFIAAMIPHHESAIEMAGIAIERAEDDEIERIARDIVEVQGTEIELMRDMEQELKRAGAPVGTLDVPESERGMDHDPASLRRADPFDPAFLRMMIDHHQGALAMAREELAKGKDRRVRSFARQVIDLQEAEIADMREHLGAGGAGDHHNP